LASNDSKRQLGGLVELLCGRQSTGFEDRLAVLGSTVLPEEDRSDASIELHAE